MILFTFDVGGTNIKFAIFDNESLIKEGSVHADTAQSMRATLTIIDKLIAQEKENLGIQNIDGIGIAYAGLVDSIHKQAIDSNGKYLDGKDINYVEWAKRNYDCDLIIENDARLACVGEWKYGAGKGYDDLSIMGLGTGIGTATIVRGKILRGKSFKAGVFGGHITLDYQGGECNCGNRGCAESTASSWALPKIVQSIVDLESLGHIRQDYENINYKDVFTKADTIPAAKKIRDFSLHIWACTAVNLIHAYDSEKIILAGGIVGGSADIIVPYIQQHVDTYAWLPEGNVSVSKAHYSSGASLRGLMYFFVHDKSLSSML